MERWRLSSLSLVIVGRTRVRSINFYHSVVYLLSRRIVTFLDCSGTDWPFLQSYKMSFRRIPFQFSSVDPAERQAELEKRFGLPASNMYVDVNNPFSTGAARIGSTRSPRLQHRVPVFLDKQEHPIQSSVEPVDQTSNKKTPNIRVIPIEIEGDYRPSSRHRNLSSPAGVPKAPPSPPPEECLKRSVEDLSKPVYLQCDGDGLKVIPIPIQIEGKDFPPMKTQKSSQKQEHPVINGTKFVKPKGGNGCANSKQVSTVGPAEKVVEQWPTHVPIVEISVENSLKKIEDILKDLESYDKGVKEFSGTVKDKQYRYLDEMLTRCMLRLDNVHTLGNYDVKTARKNAVRKVQACIDLLESKGRTEEPPSSGQSTIQATDVEMKESSEISHAEHDDSKGQSEVQMAEVKSCDEEQSEVQMTEDQSSIGEGQSEVQMADVQSSNNEGNLEVQMAEVPNSDDANKGAVSVTELDTETKEEISSLKPSIVDPAEIEMSENCQESEVKDSDETSGESAVVIEEVSDEAVGVPEVTMVDVDSESLSVVEEGSPAGCEESGEGVVVTEMDENEMSEAKVESPQTSASEKTKTDSETIQNEVKTVLDNMPANVTEL